MKIISYNVNGVRSATTKGLLDYLKQENPDIVCLQEIKASAEQADLPAIEALGYHHHWFSAQKKGYSGVAIFSKEKPLYVEIGCGHELFDFEGRVIRADFKNFSVYSAYFPSGTTGDVRQDVKYKFLDHFYSHIQEFRKKQPNLIVCGDYNICHQAIDIHDPKGNKDSSGFLPEERAWMDKWFDNGMVDTFRHLNPEKDNYTWWSFRANARNNNKGWRIDYVSITKELLPNLTGSFIHPEARHSDHCPSGMVLEMK